MAAARRGRGCRSGRESEGDHVVHDDEADPAVAVEQGPGDRARQQAGKRLAKVTMPASPGEWYSASVKSTSPMLSIDWAVRAICIETSSRPRVGTCRRARYERSPARLVTIADGIRSPCGPGAATRERRMGRASGAVRALASITQEALDLADEIVAGRLASLVDHRLEALDIGPRVRVAARGDVEAGQHPAGLVAELADGDLVVEVLPNEADQLDRRRRVGAADVVGDLRVVADGGDAAGRDREVQDGERRDGRGGSRPARE